jgi:hypothetical protein
MLLLFLHYEKKTSFNLIVKRENKYEQTKMTDIKLYIYKVNEMDKMSGDRVFDKLEEVLVLFKKISREINVIFLFIINVSFVIVFFSYFLNLYIIAM